jgi:hypothetical protein
MFVFASAAAVAAAAAFTLKVDKENMQSESALVTSGAKSIFRLPHAGLLTVADGSGRISHQAVTRKKTSQTIFSSAAVPSLLVK